MFRQNMHVMQNLSWTSYRTLIHQKLTGTNNTALLPISLEQLLQVPGFLLRNGWPGRLLNSGKKEKSLRTQYCIRGLKKKGASSIEA